MRTHLNNCEQGKQSKEQTCARRQAAHSCQQFVGACRRLVDKLRLRYQTAILAHRKFNAPTAESTEKTIGSALHFGGRAKTNTHMSYIQVPTASSPKSEVHTHTQTQKKDTLSASSPNSEVSAPPDGRGSTRPQQAPPGLRATKHSYTLKCNSNFV